MSMPDTIAWLVPILTLTVLVAFFVHSYLAFRGKLVNRFFKAWLLLWFSFILLYACPVFGLPHIIGVLTSHIVALSLFLCASALRVNQGGVSSSRSDYRRAAIFLCILTLLSFAISLQLQPQWLYTPVNILNFLALSLYAARYASVFPKAKDTVLISLFVYAGAQTLTPGPNSELRVLIAFVLLLPLKVVLYYSGYATIFYLATLRGAQGLPALPGKQKTEQGAQGSANQQIVGLSEFVKLLLRKLTGIIVLISVLSSLVNGILFLVQHQKEISEFAERLSVIFQKR